LPLEFPDADIFTLDSQQGAVSREANQPPWPGSRASSRPLSRSKAGPSHPGRSRWRGSGCWGIAQAPDQRGDGADGIRVPAETQAFGAGWTIPNGDASVGGGGGIAAAVREKTSARPGRGGRGLTPSWTRQRWMTGSV